MTFFRLKAFWSTAFLLHTVLFLACIAGFGQTASAQFSAQYGQNTPPGPFVTISLIPESNVIAAGQEFRIAIRQDIADGWHSYFLNPGDSGAEPRIDWTLPEGMEEGELHFPAPQRLPYAGLVNYGYEGIATFVQDFIAPATLPDAPLTLEASFEILVCKDICIPELSRQTLVLNDPAATPTDHRSVIESASAALPQGGVFDALYATDGQDFILTLSGPETEQVDLSSIAIFPLDWGIILNPPVTRAEQTAEGDIILRHPRDNRDFDDIDSFDTVLTYRDQDGSDQSTLLSPRPSAVVPAPAAAAELSPQPLHQSSFTMVQALIFALLGGLILNLMPCVFPVLSLKALKLVSLQEKGRLTAAAHGFAYTAGILLCFALIGGALLLVKMSGGDAGWGFQLQNPLVILALAYLLFMIGLNLSGVFDIQGIFTNAGSGWAGRQDLAGSFATGVLATLVATPCTAPFMAGAIGFALVQPATSAMAIFLTLGLGLALPYLALSLIPAFARALPKPGMWMVRLKEFLAFPIYASAAWLVWVLSIQSGSAGVMWALAGMVALGFAVWVLTNRPAKGIGRVLVLALVLLAAGFALLPFMNQALLGRADMAVQSANHHLEAEDFSLNRLDTLLAGERPVFVYMTAAWCITCKVNERIALNVPVTGALFEDKNIAVLRGDWTNMNPEITEYLGRYGRSGVPLYIFYPAPEDGERPDEIILPQILTTGLVAASINP